MNTDQFVIGAIVENRFGVLQRISGLFARRGYNIDSLNVGETENPRYSRMTIIVTGDEYIKSQIVKQLAKLHDVKNVQIMPDDRTVLRELMLVKIQASKEVLTELTEAVNTFRGKVVDFNTESITVEMTGESAKLDGFVEYARHFGIIEMCRAGALAIRRGPGYLFKV